MKLTQLLIFMLATIVGFVKTEFDPCTNHTEINDPYRSTNYSIKQGDVAICDSNLRKGWYRFTSIVGGEMPEKVPDPYHCGTVAPIWINGKHPSVINDTKSVFACTRIFRDHCRIKETIKVKKCNGYFVYELTYTYGCSMAYCAGNEKPCPKGSVGLSPNCTELTLAKFPEDLVPKPTISYENNTSQKTFSMVCKFHFNPKWTNVSFAVEWFAQNILAKKETVCRYGDIGCKRRKSYFHQDHFRAGQSVRCNIRMRYNTHPSNNFTKLWKSSNPYFAGLEVDRKLITLRECSQTKTVVTVNIRPTVPLHRELTFKLLSPKKESENRKVVAGNQCDYKLSAANQINGANVTVTILCSDLVGQESHPGGHVEYRLEHINTDFHDRFWVFGYQVSFKVLPINIKMKKCRTHNDPHINRFDGSTYTILEKGTYVFYTNLERHIEIHTRHWQCSDKWWSAGGKPMCNCGIAIREAEDVIVFSFCNEKLANVQNDLTLLHIRVRSCCPLSKATRIYEKNEGSYIKYRVVLPSGTRLTIVRWYNHLDIDLYAPTYGETIGGLCGNTYGRNADTFEESWRLLKRQENLFEKEPLSQKCSTSQKTKMWCYCTEMGTDKCPNCHERNDDTSYVKPNKMTAHLLAEKQTCKVARKRRFVVIGDAFQGDNIVLNNEDASFFSDYESDNDTSSLKHIRSRRSIAGNAMSKENATKHCKHALEESATAQMCRNISKSDITSIMSACVSDLEISGDFEFVSGAFGVMKESCEGTIFRNLSMYKNSSNGDLQPPIELVKDLCPNDCSNHGNCTSRTCICDKGYTAEDCSAEIDATPKLMGIYNEGLCDVRRRPCKKTDILGKYFLDSKNLTCHVQEHKILSTKWEPNPYPIKLRGKLFDLFGVRCDLPDPPTNITNYDSEGTPASGLWISISNNGERKSQQQLRFISYDSVCMACNRSGNCTQKENTCLINGHCFSPYQWNPKNWCQVCVPQNNSSTWTRRTDNTAPTFGSEQKKDYYTLVGENLQFKLEAKDPDNRPLKYSIITSTAGSGYSLTSSGLLQLNTSSPADFSVQVKDECNDTDTITITVHIVKCPCKNGGQCFPLPYYPRGSGQYSCYCPSGFNGTVCETNIDDCAAVDCGNGTCIDGVNNYTCRCNVGFVGSLCDQKVYRCKNDSCYPGVKCNESAGSGISCGPCPVGMSGDGKTCTAPTTTSLPTTKATTTEAPTSLPTVKASTTEGPSTPPTERTTKEGTAEHVSTTTTLPKTTEDNMMQVHTVKVEFRLIMDWEDAYSKKESEEFKFLAQKLEIEILKMYNENDNGKVKKVRIIAMRKGSIIVTVELVFMDKPSDPLRQFRKGIEGGNMGTFKVDPKTLRNKDEKNDAPSKPTKQNLFLIFALVGIGLVILTVSVVVMVVMRNRSKARSSAKLRKDGKEEIELKTPESEPKLKKVVDMEVGFQNPVFE